MAGQYFSESEIDEILGAVEETMQKAASLAKNAPPQEDDTEDAGDAPAMPQDQAPDAAAAPPAEGDPAAAMDAPPAAPGDEAGMAPEGDPSMADDMGAADPAMQDQQAAPGEEALEDDGELSDEELHQIYASMDPAELERHYMIIRSMLRDAYAKSEDSQNHNTNDEDEDMAKNEELEKEVSELKKSNAEMAKSLEAAVKAMQLIAKPERKAITQEVQVLGKSEGDAAGQEQNGGVDASTLSKDEITAELNRRVRGNLSKDERQAINDYLLSKGTECKEEVFKILGSK